MALNFRFWCIFPVAGLSKNSGTGNALTSYLVWKTMSCEYRTQFFVVVVVVVFNIFFFLLGRVLKNVSFLYQTPLTP